MLLALLARGRRQKALTWREGFWIQTEVLHEPDARFVELVRRRLGGISAAEAEVLRIVALTEPLELETLLRLSGQESVDVLIAQCLIRVSDGFVVTSFNRMYAVELRRTVPLGQSRALLSHVEGIQNGRPGSGPGIRRAVEWTAWTGRAETGARLLRAARAVNRAFDPEAAHRFSSWVSEPGLAAAACVETARADFHRGKQASARSRLRAS